MSSAKQKTSMQFGGTYPPRPGGAVLVLKDTTVYLAERVALPTSVHKNLSPPKLVSILSISKRLVAMVSGAPGGGKASCEDISLNIFPI